MKTKKLLAIVLAAVMMLAMTACLQNNAPASNGGETSTEAQPAESSTDAAPATTTGSDGAPAITSTDKIDIIWSHNSPESSAGHKIALKFKEEMETRSGGNITVNIYANGELGSVPENDQALREGSIQIGSGTSGGLIDKRLSYFDAPNLVSSNEQALAMIGRDTDLFKYTAGIYNDMGLQVLSLVPGGFRETSSNKEIRSFDDLKGLKIRTLENPTAIAYWQSWGCNPTPVAFSDLYLALQQGLVEAQENAYNTISSSKLYEQQKYIVNTHHVIMWSGIYMNKAFHDSLPDDYRALLDWVCINVMDSYAYERNIADNDEALQVMKDAGLEVIDLTEEDYAKMREAAAPAYELIRNDVGDEAMNILEAAIAAANG